MENNTNQYNSAQVGFMALSLRLVIGWTYFSAFWRRLVLENKLDPETAGYIGEKFNHFLPHALGIKPMIQYLVLNPDALWWSMAVFTIIEAIVGLLLMFGAFTRLVSIGVISLAMGILLGSGWIGTTCLDEWQIGVLGVAGGFTLFLIGGGTYSLDNYFIRKKYSFTQTKWYHFLGSGRLPIEKFKPLILSISFAIFFLTLFTNQVFHGGVWGTLHNKSVRPKLEISDIIADTKALHFDLYRVEGADVYGSFLIGIQILDKNGQEVFALDGEDLAHYDKSKIENYHVAKIKSGKYSLVIPLGAKAKMSVSDLVLNRGEHYTLKLIDISGLEWQEDFSIE